MKKLQENKIRNMIEYAYYNVPYYQRVFKKRNLRPENIQNAEDLKRIPVLTHESVRQHQDDLIATTRPKDSLFRCQTGGTTGHPLVVYEDKNELSSAQACLYRGREWCGYPIGEKRALIWGRPLAASTYATLKSSVTRLLTRCVFIGAWYLGQRRIVEIIDRLNATKPVFISGYTSPICLVADFITQ
ncbi:hypothetical protein GTO27_02130, partial [Candidatus Bathyarchaeota archaeon]|nr:hypothetical protein [Candidatus Bathyarchaeota archaeon]